MKTGRFRYFPSALKVVEAVNASIPPGKFETWFHLSTGDGAGPDSLGEQPKLPECPHRVEEPAVDSLLSVKVAEQHQKVLDDYNRDLESGVAIHALEEMGAPPFSGPRRPRPLTKAENQEQYIRHEVTRLNVDMGYWTPQQGVTFVETGCHDCADGTDDRDRDFRCLEHRKYNGIGYERQMEVDPWGRPHLAALYKPVDGDGIAALDLEAPDSIERRHQRAANRWGQVRSSYRRR